MFQVGGDAKGNTERAGRGVYLPGAKAPGRCRYQVKSTAEGVLHEIENTRVSGLAGATHIGEVGLERLDAILESTRRF